MSKTNKKVFKKRAPYKKRAAKRSTKSTFAKKVQRVVTRMAEKKQTTTTQINVPLTTGDNSILVPNFTMVPTLSQGSAENGRIGNSVKVTYAKVAGYINMLPYNATTNTFPNLKVRVMLASYKNRNVLANSSPNVVVGDFDTFFDNGANGVPFQGTMYDILAPVNSQRWTIHSQRILDLSLGGSTTSYPNTTVPVNGNGSYQKYFSFSFAKQLGKLTWDDTIGSNYPTNKNLYLLIQPITTDGSARQAGPIAEVHYKWDVHYTDL